jgi:hypothetical protein
VRSEETFSRSGRRLALVSVAATFAFMGVEFAGATLGWSNQTMGLLELGFLAVFLWVIIQAIGMWRQRQTGQDG